MPRNGAQKLFVDGLSVVNCGLDKIMAANHAEIDPEQCKGCRLCVEVCPRGCLVIGSDINRSGCQYARFEQKNCTACGFCFFICPEPGAITVFKRKRDTK